MFSYADKKAVVTGAGRGIGRQIALDFARQGADVVLAARTREQIDAVAGEIEALGRRAWPIVTDMGDLDAALGLVDSAIAAMGRIDVWVNNAGGGSSVKGGIGPLEEATIEGFDAIYQLNVRAPFFRARKVADHMAAGGGGAILNIVSIDGVHAAPGEAIYGSAKAALVSLTQTMGIEYGRHNVRINAIAPSLAKHPFLVKVTTKELLEELEAKEAYGRGAEPWEMANIMIFLASDYATYLTGEIISASSQHA